SPSVIGTKVRLKFCPDSGEPGDVPGYERWPCIVCLRGDGSSVWLNGSQSNPGRRGSFQGKGEPCLGLFRGLPSGDSMKSANWTRMRAASAAGACLAMLFITCGARAQETKETVTVNDVDRTYIVRLPKGYDRERKYPVVILLHGMNQE